MLNLVGRRNNPELLIIIHLCNLLAYRIRIRVTPQDLTNHLIPNSFTLIVKCSPKVAPGTQKLIIFLRCVVMQASAAKPPLRRPSKQRHRSGPAKFQGFALVNLSDEIIKSRILFRLQLLITRPKLQHLSKK